MQGFVKYFFRAVGTNEVWKRATERGLLRVPLALGWEERPMQTPIVSVLTRPKHAHWLAFHLWFSSYCIMPLEPPAVPKGQSRLRLTFHAGNTEAEIDGLVAAIAQWAQEMMDLEDREASDRKEASELRMPSAAQQVYAWMGNTEAEPVALQA